MSAIGYLHPATPTAELDQQADGERERLGFVMNATRLWSHLPRAKQTLFDLMELAAEGASLTYRQRAVLVTASAATLGDPYCCVAWGSRLAHHAGVDVAANILEHRCDLLDDEDRVLAEWARKVVAYPTATTTDDIDRLRAAGFSDEQIFSLTAFVALRVTFSTVNDSLGAQPDQELVDRAPDEIVRYLDELG
jgi:uncharacterized peroxidase-related enzyme